MTIDAGELRRKAEACRRLAAMGETDEHTVAWLRRADEWERLAVGAIKEAGSAVRKGRLRRLEARWQSAGLT